MESERLDTKIQIIRPAQSVDIYGARAGSSREWNEGEWIWADRSKYNGDTVNESGEIFSDYRAEFRVRYAHEILEGWRIRERGGLLYVVRNVIPDRRNGMRTIKCEKVNR